MMVQRTPTLRYRRYNTYVPAMGYSHEVLVNGGYETDFGMPAAGTGVEILNAQSIATVGNTSAFVNDTIGTNVNSAFGRNLTIVASGATTVPITVRGKDYLGQGMVETFTLNGTTAVQGVKAFKWIDRVDFGTAAAGVTINVGYGPRLGLPFRMASVDQEIVNGSQVNNGTLTAGSLTDPATATSLDPRGLYTPTGVLNGSNRILAIFAPYNVVNSNGNGGLHGIAHFAG